MADRQLLWREDPSGDGETLHGAFRRIAGRELDLSRCLFEDVYGDRSVFVFKDRLEVTVAFGGACKIERVVPDAGAGSVCSAHRTPEPGCPLCGLPGPQGGAP